MNRFAIGFVALLLISSIHARDPVGADRLEQRALQGLVDATGGTARVSLHSSTGVARFIRLVPGSLSLAGAGPVEQTTEFFSRHGESLGVSDAASELAPPEIRVDRYGSTRLTYNQIFHGLPVFAGVLRTHFNTAGQMIAVNGTFLPDIDIDPRPTRTAAEAASVAATDVLSRIGSPPAVPLNSPSTRLGVFRSGLVRRVQGRDHLVWQVEVGNGHDVRETLFVDAHTGKIVDRINGIHRLDRKIHKTAINDVILWSEGDALPYTGGSQNEAAQINGLIDYAEDTYDLFSILSGGTHLSWDGTDGTMHSVWKSNLLSCPNAAWNGSSTLFCDGVASDDIVAHEWTHGYTQATHGLVMQWQPGSLNEAYSDIFGEVVDLINGAGTDAPDVVRAVGDCTSNSVRWLVAEDASGYGGANGDLWNPACFDDPGSVSASDYHCSSSDSGGIHTNSGVPNHAFALLVDGGSYNGQTISGIGLTKATHIYWRAMNVYQVPDTDFSDHADALAQSCVDLVAVDLDDLTSGLPSGQTLNGSDCNELDEAMLAVEMADDPPCNFDPLLDPAPPGLSCGAVAFLDDFESDPTGTWTFTNSGVFSEYTPRDWVWTSQLPSGGAGSALFGIDSVTIGNCIVGDDDQSGVMRAATPPIALGGEASVAFDHWVATEPDWDGGNVKISVNGGSYQLIGGIRFTFNSYNGSLETTAHGNTNPLSGEAAFSGSNEGEVAGSWGQSQIDLSSFADEGDTIRLRFDLGVDGCNGLVGWYVDNLLICTSENGAGSVPDGGPVGGTPLRLAKAGSELTLSWDDSCLSSDTDYEVYEGTLGIFSSHTWEVCSTDQATSWTLTPAAGNRYYLVVPRSVDREGSYGFNWEGGQRPPAGDACLPQSLAPACD